MRKSHTLFAFSAALVLTGAAYAAPANTVPANMKYFKVEQECSASGMNKYNCSGPLLLSQSESGCVAGEVEAASFFTSAKKCVAASSEIKSVKEIGPALNTVVSSLPISTWQEAGSKLKIASDINMGDSTTTGSCVAPFVPLTMPIGSNNVYFTFDGGKAEGYKIRNLCYEQDMNDSVMTHSVGFLKDVVRFTVENVEMKQVRIAIKDSRTTRDASKAGADYYPVGALAGTVSQSTVRNIFLADVSITAPMAGGVMGYVKESSIRQIVANDDIRIGNDIELTYAKGNYAGSKITSTLQYLTEPSEYTVFLGGIAGMAVKDSMDNIKVRAKVEDLSSETTPSTLGGLAGIFAHNDNSFRLFNDTLELKAATAEYGAGFSMISGGKAMGGLFGEVAAAPSDWQVMSNLYSSIILENCRVDSLKISNGKTESVFAGGLVGRVSSGKLYKVSFVNNVANVEISDSLKKTLAGGQSYNYYAGGVLGYGENDENYCAIDSIIGSRTSGSIRVAANSTNVSGLKANAYLGGVAGSACIKTKSDGFAKNSSSMHVESAVMTGDNNVFAGGLLGAASIFGNVEMILKNLTFTGSVKVAAGSDVVNVGGVLGGFINDLRSNKVSFNSVNLENKTEALVTVASDGFSAAGAEVSVGGLCGSCVKLSSVTRVSIVGDVVVDDDNFAGDKLLVGGFFGSVNTALPVSVYNNYNIGDVSVPEDSRAKTSVKVGYLMGSAEMTGAKNNKIEYNYHYGENDAAYIDAFGAISTGSGDIMDSWKSNEVSNWSFRYNVQNGSVSNLSAYENGVQITAAMQTSEFAGYLNTNQKPYVWSFESNYNDNLPIFADETHLAVAPGTNPTHTVVFVYYKKDEESGTFVKYNHPVTVVDGQGADAPTVPERPGYTYKRWDKDFASVLSDMTVTAVYEINTYKIIFANGLDNLQDETLEYMTVPEYKGLTPSREANAQWTYKFVGWTPEIAPVTEDKTYKAVFDSSAVLYKVVFKNDGETIDQQSLTYGSVPSTSVSPTRASTAQYTFSFKGWNPALSTVIGEAEYTAVYDTTVNKYKIVFKTDANKSDVIEVAYGEMPVYTKTPERKTTASHTFKFNSWFPTIALVDGEATYEAVFDSTVRKFSVEFKNGDVLLQSDSLAYGEVPNYTKANPTKKASASHTYNFIGWSKKITTVVENAVYTAVFDSVPNTYKVTFLSNLGKILKEDYVPYGESADAPKNLDLGEYKFVGWSTEFDNVTDDIIVLALVDFPKPNSSSSALPSSSSEVPSSSSEVPSSSSEPPASSSSVFSSSSFDGSDVKIVDARIEQSGNAVRLTFGNEGLDEGVALDAHVLVSGAKGVFVDTVIENVVDGVDNVWELVPAPLGESKIVLTLLDGETELATFEDSFDVSREISVTPRSWQMVSLAAIDSKARFNGDDAAFYWWDETNPVGDYWQYRAYQIGDDFEETRGFWYGTQHGESIVLEEESAASDADIVWDLDYVYSGWNLVANPHGWYVDLSKGEGGDVEFWRWNPVTGEYEIPTVLGPYEAVWAKVGKPTTWTVPAKPVYEFKSIKAKVPPALAKSGVNGGWSVRVMLSDDMGKKDSWNFLGAGNAARMDEAPSGMGDHVALSIVDGKSRLAKSFKAFADEYSWELDASASSDRDGFISFEGMESLRASGLKLFVTADGKTTEVKGSEKVRVMLKTSSSTVSVRVAKSEVKALANNNLKAFSAVQVAGNLKVGFDVPENLVGSNARIDLVSVNGKVANTVKFKALAGTNSVNLETPKSGLYFVRVQVGSQKATSKVMVK